MGHPDRRPKRERKRKRQKMLARRNLYEQTLDLTPYNAVGPMVQGEEFTIKYKQEDAIKKISQDKADINIYPLL